MCPPLPLLICCLFCFLSVPSPKRFGKVQISVLTAQCSKRKGEKQKGWRRGEDGGGEETQPLALARLEEHGDGRPGAGFALRTKGGFGGLFLLGVLGVTLATSARMHHSSTVPLCWPSLVGGEGWKNKVYSSSCKMWAEALGEKPRGS